MDVVFSLLLSLFVFAASATALALRERARGAALRKETAALRADLERIEAILDGEPGVRLVFSATGGHRLFGDSALADALIERDALAFSNWAQPHANAALSRRLDALRARGEAFLIKTAARDGRLIEAKGRSAGGVAVLTLTALPVEAEKMEKAAPPPIDLIARAGALDQLGVAVAIFDSGRRLRGVNAAWRALFGLDAEWVASAPDEADALDALRKAGKLPQEADYRLWKRDFLARARSGGRFEDWWHLPNGDTLRVLIAADPNGGAVYVYEDHTERLHLESRYNSLIRMQRETLDALREGVAVFGSDGRLRLSNPAFARIWSLDAAPARMHMDDVALLCRPLCDGDGWERIKTAALSGERLSESGRIEQTGGAVTDYVVEPLPDGATLVTFADVTADAVAQRALEQKNDSLEAADALKSLFVRHVSYELRTPLTPIIGFGALLADPQTGPLNALQREYVEHVSNAGAALQSIIDGILDLTTIDAGTMELNVEEVDLCAAASAAADEARPRLVEAGLTLDVDIDPRARRLRADERRIQQILFNLLSNAARFANGGGRVRLSARRDGEGVRLTVSDDGPGIAPEKLARIFDRFEAWPAGDKRNGVGLGLALVKSFVELHGGSVSVRSKVGRGVVASCFFPDKREEREEPAAMRRSAAHARH